MGGREATVHLAERMDLKADTTVLDTGCGIGGPARLLPGYSVLAQTGRRDLALPQASGRKCVHEAGLASFRAGTNWLATAFSHLEVPRSDTMLPHPPGAPSICARA